jgi:hypothetical protein
MMSSDRRLHEWDLIEEMEFDGHLHILAWASVRECHKKVVVERPGVRGDFAWASVPNDTPSRARH